jgi:AcrR family transcriptional regulator
MVSAGGAPVEREERRNQILECAKRLFSEKGYHATTVADIIEAAKIARGTFYLYFESKRGIFEALLEHLFSLLQGKVKRIDVSAGTLESVVEQVHTNVDGIIGIFIAQREMTKILLSEAVGLDAGFDRKLFDFYNRLNMMLRLSLERGIAMGILRPFDVRVVSSSILGSVKEVMYHYVMGDELPDREATVREIMNYNLYGILAGAGRGEG